jgi:hypothetical protein
MVTGRSSGCLTTGRKLVWEQAVSRTRRLESVGVRIVMALSLLVAARVSRMLTTSALSASICLARTFASVILWLDIGLLFADARTLVSSDWPIVFPGPKKETHWQPSIIGTAIVSR